MTQTEAPLRKRLTRRVGGLAAHAERNAVRPRLHTADGRDLLCFALQEHDRSQSAFGSPGRVLCCQFADHAPSRLRQRQDIHRLRYARPWDPEPAGEVRPAVHHPIVEEALELEGALDDAPSGRGTAGEWSRCAAARHRGSENRLTASEFPHSSCLGSQATFRAVPCESEGRLYRFCGWSPRRPTRPGTVPMPRLQMLPRTNPGRSGSRRRRRTPSRGRYRVGSRGEGSPGSQCVLAAACAQCTRAAPSAQVVGDCSRFCVATSAGRQ